MKLAIAVLALTLVLISAQSQQSQTLADVLHQNSIPFASIPRLNSPITSYSTLNNTREFVIAYYLANDTNELRFPLYISELDKHSGQWHNIEFKDITLAVPEGIDSRTVDCLGSVLKIERYDPGYYLNLHFNPSAGCLIVLDSHFRVVHTYPGGAIAIVGKRMLWEANTVHFADVHPEQIWIYDPEAVRSEQVYPQPGDPLRKSFEQRLAKVIDRKNCMANNWACDPRRFTSETNDLRVNDETKAFAFRVHFSTEGFLTREEAEKSGTWDDDDYVYVYRLKPFVWRAFSLYDLKPKFGTDSLQELLTPDALKKIFTDPAN